MDMEFMMVHYSHFAIFMAGFLAFAGMLTVVVIINGIVTKIQELWRKRK